jgi:CheY-like chemotaxis protein
MRCPLPILVVDDDQEIRDAVGGILSDEGYRVEFADNGQTALEILEKGERPCIVLLDLMMPVMDGWVFMRRLRAATKFSDVPVVAITAVPRVQAPPTTGFLEKPLSLGPLLEMIEKYCHEEGRPSGRPTVV